MSCSVHPLGLEPRTYCPPTGTSQAETPSHQQVSAEISHAQHPETGRKSAQRGDEGATEKRCARCTETLPVTAFSRRGTNYQPYCKPCATANLRDWLKRPGNRARLYDATTASKQRHPERDKARHKLNAAVRSGRLVPGPCEIGQGCAGKVEAHHDDYSQPLAVRWLCRGHHAALHRKVAA